MSNIFRSFTNNKISRLLFAFYFVLPKYVKLLLLLNILIIFNNDNRTSLLFQNNLINISKFLWLSLVYGRIDPYL